MTVIGIFKSNGEGHGIRFPNPVIRYSGHDNVDLLPRRDAADDRVRL